MKLFMKGRIRETNALVVTIQLVVYALTLAVICIMFLFHYGSTTLANDNRHKHTQGAKGQVPENEDKREPALRNWMYPKATVHDKGNSLGGKVYYAFMTTTNEINDVLRFYERHAGHDTELVMDADAQEMGSGFYSSNMFLDGRILYKGDKIEATPGTDLKVIRCADDSFKVPGLRQSGLPEPRGVQIRQLNYLSLHEQVNVTVSRVRGEETTHILLNYMKLNKMITQEFKRESKCAGL